MSVHHVELVAGTEMLVTTLGIYSAGQGVIPALTPLMLDATTGGLVPWDGAHPGQAVYVSAMEVDTAARTQCQVYKTGVLNVEALNWPETVTTLPTKVSAFVGSGISVQSLSRV
ncbi:head decoration protein [Cedecea sp. S5-13]|uniref:head decoration protein n=1 Tax=Cedecea selenatireducens TaxID=3144416 RepID=UPI0035CCF88E